MNVLQFDEEISQRLGFPLDSSPSTDSNNNSDSEKSSPSRGDKYSLRPRSLRRRHAEQQSGEDEGQQIIGRSRQKSKQKPAPLSKYRRKTANARERSRMREINQAFESLRKAVPQMGVTQPGNEKLTKITTLRLAMKYISALSSVLNNEYENGSQDLLSDCSELDSILLESDGESIPIQSDLSDHSMTPPDFSMDFPDDTFIVDFASPFSPDFSQHLTHSDPFLSGFS